MIDLIDSAILRELGAHARLSNVELGRAVGLSPNAAGVRVQRLIEQGIISGFHAHVDYAKLGRPIEATIDVWVDREHGRGKFEAAVPHDDRIIECFHLTGPLDFRMRVRVASTDDLNELLQSLKDHGGVHQTDTRLLLEQLPIAQLAP